jgi:hypothetical protein
MNNATKTMTAVAILVMLAVMAPTVAADSAGFDGVDQQTTAAALPSLAVLGTVFVASGRTKKQTAQLTRAVLMERAETLGIRVTSKMSKSALEEAIAEQTLAMESIPPTGSGQIRRFDARDQIDLPFQRAVEIRGKVKSVGHPNNSGITIIDDDGVEHKCSYSNWTALGQALERGLDGFYYSTWTPGGGKKAAVDMQNAMLQEANAIPMDKRPTVRFVVITHRNEDQLLERPVLYSVVTDTYTQIASEDIYNRLIDLLPPEQYQYRLRGNDGVHAGSIQVTQRDSDAMGIFNWTINIDCGNFNGMNSIKVSGGMRVLFCSNQISLDVMRAARDLGVTIDVGSNSNMTRRHAGDLDGIIDQINSVAGYGASGDVNGMVQNAISQDLTNDEFTDVVDYYTDVKGLSSKVRDLIFDSWDNDAKSQIPETLYGAIMAVTYAGTHTSEMKDGVEQKLRVMGGELMAIAPHFGDLLPAIQERAEKGREAAVEKAKVAKPWAVTGAEGLITNRDGSILGFKTIDHAQAWIDENQPKDAPFKMAPQVWGTLPTEPEAESDDAAATA